jgi:hypothetical protein
MLGAGDPHLERAFSTAAREHPGRIGVRVGYDESLAHRIIAGADAFARALALRALRPRATICLAIRNVTGRCAAPVGSQTRSTRRWAFLCGSAETSIHETIERAIDTYRNGERWATMQDRSDAARSRLVCVRLAISVTVRRMSMKIFLPLTVAASLALVGSLALARNSHPTGPAERRTPARTTRARRRPAARHRATSIRRAAHDRRMALHRPALHHRYTTPKHGHMGMGGAPSNGPGM